MESKRIVADLHPARGDCYSIAELEESNPISMFETLIDMPTIHRPFGSVNLANGKFMPSNLHDIVDRRSIEYPIDPEAAAVLVQATIGVNTLADLFAP